MPVAPRILNDVPYVLESDFVWQAQYLVLEGDACCSAHCK